MQTNQIRAAGAIAAVIAAGAVGYSLRPGTQPVALAARNPAVEVRTVVIRRTIHIVRHERARPPLRHVARAVAAPGQAPAQPTGQPVAATAVRTRTSHHAVTAQPSSGQPVASSAPLRTSTSKHGTTSTPPAVVVGSSAPLRTSTSKHAAAGTSGTTHGAPVTTRTSGSHGGPVTTRTSGKGGEDGGGDGSDN